MLAIKTYIANVVLPIKLRDDKSEEGISGMRVCIKTENGRNV